MVGPGVFDGADAVVPLIAQSTRAAAAERATEPSAAPLQEAPCVSSWGDTIAGGLVTVTASVRVQLFSSVMVRV